MMEGMSALGRALLVCGGIAILFGVIVLLIGKIPLLGKLPGDVVIRKGNFTFYFPITTCIILSLICALIAYFLRR